MKQNYLEKITTIETVLPSLVTDYINYLDEDYQVRTKYSYLQDLKIFFEYIIEAKAEFNNLNMTQFTERELNLIDVKDIINYKQYLNKYEVPRETKSESNEIIYKTYENSNFGKARKLSALRSFFNYLFEIKVVTLNPVELVRMPKIEEKVGDYLDAEEIRIFLDHVSDCSSSLTQQQLKYYNKYKNRDLAIITLLLSSGIRVSECVGLDINDVDYRTNSIKIIRKGGQEAIVYFNDEAAKALSTYMDVREEIVALTGHEKALFLSAQKKRLSVNSIENIVKKYSKEIIYGKTITPHRLRASFATLLFSITHNSLEVADCLGHKSSIITEKHYIGRDQSAQRTSVNKIKLHNSTTKM